MSSYVLSATVCTAKGHAMLLNVSASRISGG